MGKFAVVIGFLFVSAAPAWAVAFDTTSIVGAAQNSNGVVGACVIVSTTQIRCGYWLGTGWQWCNAYTLSNGTAYNTNTGIYLAPNYYVNWLVGYDENAFLPVYNSTDSIWEVDRLRLVWDIGSMPTCVYDEVAHPFPYINGYSNPDIAPHLALAGGSGSGDPLYVFSIAPASDTYASGALLGARYASQGSGAATDLYSSGHWGILNNRDFVADGGTSTFPIAAILSSLTSTPLVVGLDGSDTSKFLAVYLDAADGGHELTSASVGVADKWTSLAIANVPTQTLGTATTGFTTYGDSIFGVEQSNGELYEVKFKYGSTYLLDSLSYVGTNGIGNALDTTTDSLAASWYYTNTTQPPRAIAYARRDASHGDAVSTDLVNGGATTWSSYTSGIPNATNYDGVQCNIPQPGSGQDWLFSACDSGGATELCGLTRSWGATTQTWSTY